ncbi:MAG: nucleotide pyrophosphatase [Moorea sp. SIO4G2]|nr:nucleotide pyrophosphatase [Moorena sp. SIO4G2]
MKTPVIAIGLDAADPLLLEKWMSQGHLKTLNKIRQQGIYGRLNNTVNYNNKTVEFSSTEPLWVMFSTGCLPDKTGFWDTIKFYPETYKVVCDKIYSGYDYKEYNPFYALGNDYRFAAFDVPVSALSDQINGLQILGWGGHYPFVPSHSQPPELLPNIISQYGKNPVLHKDNGRWWDPVYFKWIQEALKTSISTRSEICRDLLQREPWDLFVTAFGETHSAGHDLWDRSQPDHQLYPYQSKKNGKAGDPMLKIFEAVDDAIAKIIAAAPKDAYILCFAVHGMAANVTDLMSMMFLPELVYRYNFPGKYAITPSKIGVTPPPPITRPIRNSWPGEVWRKIYEPNPIKQLFNTWTHKAFLQSGQHGLLSPYPLMKHRVQLGWMPATLYTPLWPKMKAFALPAFADGHIRINLKGRERDGIVEPSEYDALCDNLTDFLYRLTDGRTGEPLVKQVVRTHNVATDDNPKLPDADLVVVWHECPTDVVDSPDVGRIGPITYNRPGGHRARGFLMASGPGITPGSSLPEAHPVDIAPTILTLMGAPIPDYFDGKSLLSPTLSISA